MSLKCERKTLHKYYSYRDKINVKKKYTVLYMFIIFTQYQVEKKKLTLMITDMITLQCH